MSAVTLRSSLKTILDTVSSSVMPLKFDYGETLPTSFPAGIILHAGTTGEEQVDTITNKEDHRFIIRLIFPVAESSTFETKRLTLLDTIKATFRKDDYQTLSGNAINVQVGESLPYRSNDYIQPVMIYDIILTVTVLNYINL